MNPAVLALVVLAVLAAGCASAAAPPPGPPDPRSMAPPGVKQEWLHFHDSVVEPGAPAPDFTLATADGRNTLSLSTFRGRPLVLVFGSNT